MSTSLNSYARKAFQSNRTIISHLEKGGKIDDGVGIVLVDDLVSISCQNPKLRLLLIRLTVQIPRPQ